MPDDFDYSKPVSRQRQTAESVPLFTMAFIVLCVTITAAYWIVPEDNGSPAYKLGHFAVLDPAQIWDGRYMALFTSFFVHLSIMHLAFNMMWLWKLGSALEMTVPAWKYLLFMLIATMVGSCCELLLSGSTGAGASGAGYAMMGLLWGGRGFHRSWEQVATKENMRLFLVWGAICIYLTVSHTLPVANGAHFGGLLFGVAIGKLFFAPARKPVWIGALALLALTCALSLTWMPWSYSWNWYKGMQAGKRNHHADAIVYYERSIRTGGDKAALLGNIAIEWFNITNQALGDNHPEEAKRAAAKAEEASMASTAAALKAASDPSNAGSGGRATDESQTPSDQQMHRVK